MRTSSTSTLVRASYRWPMQGLGLSFGSEDVDNMIGTKVCEGCKVSFFFPKHPSLVSTVFGGRIPTARSSSCALWPWVSVRFFLFWPDVVPKQLRSKFSAQTGGNSPLERQTRGFWQGTLSKRGKRGQLSVFSVLLSRKMQNGIHMELSLKIWHEPIQSATQAQDHELQVKLQDLFFLSNSVGFGVFNHSKGLRANWHVWGSLGQVGLQP